MLWKGKLSTRSCKSLWQGSGTSLFLPKLSAFQHAQGTELLPRFDSRPQSRGRWDAGLGKPNPTALHGDQVSNTAWSINRQCAAALGYSLLPAVRSSYTITPPWNRPGNRNRYQYLRAHLCPPDWGKPQLNLNKNIDSTNSCSPMSWSREKKQTGDTKERWGERQVENNLISL